MRARKPKGSVVFNKARTTWNFLWLEQGKRRSRRLGTLIELPTRADALRKADTVRRDLRLQQERAIVTLTHLIDQYRAEKMPKRNDTRRAYEVWLRNYILPLSRLSWKWRKCSSAKIAGRTYEKRA
jgi:hypothetical protein